MRVVSHLLVACGALVCAASAQAAAVATDLPCYLEDRRIQLTGSGFTPDTSYTVLRDGTAIGQGTVAPDGTVSGAFSSQTLGDGIAERSFELTVADGSTQAATAFRVTAFRALFSPARGDPARLRVRFSVFGFGTPGLPVYVHYVRPHGGVVRSVKLGTTRGTCGHLAPTRRRKLFPFRATRGRWLLQFDTHLTYRTTAVPRIVRAVNVSRAGR